MTRSNESDWFLCYRHSGRTSAEAVLLHCPTSSPVSGLTSSSSSSLFDQCSSTSQDSASGHNRRMYVCVVCLCVCLSFNWCVSLSSSGSYYGSYSGDTDVSPDRDASTNLGVPEFPAADSQEGAYYQDVLLAVERWFSLFGWPRRPHPISVPHTLRRSSQHSFPVQLLNHTGDF